MEKADKLLLFIEELKNCIAPSFKQGNDRPPEKDDYQQFIHDQEIRLAKLCENIKRQPIEDKHICVKRFMLPFIIVTLENDREMPWNNLQILNIFSDIKNLLFKKFSAPVDFNQFINIGVNLGKSCEMESLFKPILKELRPKLLHDTWKYNPAAVECMRYITNVASYSHIADNVPSIMPIGLMLTDDFILENRLIGVQILKRLCDNMTVAELKHHGHGKVFYKALLSCIRVREPKMVSCAPFVLASLCHKMDLERPNDPLPTEWSLMDDFLEVWLEGIEIEHKHEMRECNAQALCDLLPVFNGKLHTWCKRILRIFSDYLKIDSSPKTITVILNALTQFVDLTEHFSSTYRFEVSRILSKLMASKSFKSIENFEVINDSTNCLFTRMWVTDSSEKVLLTKESVNAIIETKKNLQLMKSG